MILSRDRLSGDIRFLDVGNRIYYHTEFMFQPKSILKEVNTRKDLDYPLLPMEEILQCGSRDYFPENKATAALLKELNKRKVSNPKELVRTAYIMLQNDLGIQNIIQLFPNTSNSAVLMTSTFSYGCSWISATRCPNGF